ncbi:hypothetical protein M407DRAFT_18854 [Tulasnella calospora MUT 4182]|uniref:NADH:flavin oxidoreductase/NADH oxidase N-terminal domain-containing protein n=1 Tax=Tulasnella calospora MUT 4182 TaxID=1051891 RepID=A0A0C3LEE2_9AGAM|nr:hypothetical protein M407DRAFT_18854 [Tulasnella calospora MUT 4182]
MSTVEQEILSTTQILTLSSPIKVGDVELRDRNFMSAMTRNRSVPTTIPTDANVEYVRKEVLGSLLLKPVPGPSALAARGVEGHYVRYGLPAEAGYSVPVLLEDPRTVIEEFKFAGANAKEAGFDGVEAHSANGYLFNELLDMDELEVKSLLPVATTTWQ